MHSPCMPSSATSMPLCTLDTMPFMLSTAGICSALARMAEWDVCPPTSVRMPTTFSFTMPAVMEGVRSVATSTVPAGTSATFTSGVPVRIFNILIRISLMSVTLCCKSSSPVIWNIWMNISQALSNAASAQVPPLMVLLVISSMPGSFRRRMCPSKISALCSPTWLRMVSAIACVFFSNDATASSYLFISASVSVMFFTTYSGFASDITTTLPTP